MKDPAFLFYFRDFKSSTENMSNAARGAYIQLLCMQAENGFITEQDMKKICSNICYDTMQILLDKKTYLEVKSRFSEKKPGSGEFINSRLETEIKKRANYCESRRKNKNSKKEKTYDTTYVSDYESHMTDHMVNRNINVNNIEIEIEKGVQGEKQIFGQNPRFDDPTEAGINTPDPDQPDWTVFRLHTGIAADQLQPAFESYRDMCIADNVTRDRRGHLAGFKKWCTSWAKNEEKAKNVSQYHNGKNNASESILATKQKLAELAELYR